MKIIKCETRHLPRVAEIFRLAFSDSLGFFTPSNHRIDEALVDIFSLLQMSFGDGFLLIADGDGVIHGYIFAADNVRRLWLAAIRSGLIFKWLFNWVRGKYGIGLKSAWRIALNKFYYLRFETGTASVGQILSVAVDPAAHGRGYGRELLRAGLEYLKSQGVHRVKLEVRPDNIPALKLYSRFGFKPVGKARDLQGEWLIMLREDETEC